MVLDAGGQYCHLLARRVREIGVQSHVLPIDTPAAKLTGISGIIISGGPRSVTEAGSPRIDPSILKMGVPILGICYGHQLLAATLPGGVVKPSYSREYGLAKLSLVGSRARALFENVPEASRVWVSHGDSVETLPEGFEVFGSTNECAVAAMGNADRAIYGVQFHPEANAAEIRTWREVLQAAGTLSKERNRTIEEDASCIASDEAAFKGRCRLLLESVLSGAITNKVVA